MLVLVRKCNESIAIGGGILITVLAVEGDRVKLGIEAPREVTILRHELCDQVISENRVAAESARHVAGIIPSLRDKLFTRKDVER